MIAGWRRRGVASARRSKRRIAGRRRRLGGAGARHRRGGRRRGRRRAPGRRRHRADLRRRGHPGHRRVDHARVDDASRARRAPPRSTGTPSSERSGASSPAPRTTWANCRRWVSRHRRPDRAAAAGHAGGQVRRRSTAMLAGAIALAHRDLTASQARAKAAALIVAAGEEADDRRPGLPAVRAVVASRQRQKPPADVDLGRRPAVVESGAGRRSGSLSLRARPSCRSASTS